MAEETTFVLVHGAWHGGWCYARVAERLRAAGHRVYTPSLTGCGERGDNQHLFWAVRRDVLEEKRDVIVDFFEDYLRGQRWAMEPENREELMELIAQFTDRPASDFEWSFREGTGYYREQDLRLNHEVFQRTADALHEVGFLEQFDTAPYIDDSVIEEALARLN